MTQAQSGGKRTGRRGWWVVASALLLIFLSACSSATRPSTSAMPTTSRPSSSSRPPQIGEVLMPNPASLWATLDNGLVFHSSDGGAHGATSRRRRLGEPKPLGAGRGV